jgi:hypothetical protein
MSLRSRKLRQTVASVALFTSALGAEARAQTAPSLRTEAAPSTTVTQADRLFEEGVARLDAGDFARACPLLEQSQALDPSSGTLLNLGECYERLGRTASAWRAFGEAGRVAAATGRADRVEVAELRRQRLVAELRKLVVVPPAAAVAGLSLHLDELELPPSDFRTPIPVDPGVHVIRASAPAHSDVVLRVEAPEPGASKVVLVPALVFAPAASAQAAPPSAGPAVAEWQRPAAIACAAFGGVGLIAGTVFGLRSMSKHEASDEYCDGDVCHDKAGVDLMESARTAGNISTAAFIAGGVGLGAAGVLWFVPLGRKEPPAGAEVGVGLGSVRVRGAW